MNTKKLGKKTIKTAVKITWSIHECRKSVITTYKKAKGMAEGGSQVGYMVVKNEGKKKVRTMHNTLGSALNNVGV